MQKTELKLKIVQHKKKSSKQKNTLFIRIRFVVLK